MSIPQVLQAVGLETIKESAGTGQFTVTGRVRQDMHNKWMKWLEVALRAADKTDVVLDVSQKYLVTEVGLVYCWRVVVKHEDMDRAADFLSQTVRELPQVPYEVTEQLLPNNGNRGYGNAGSACGAWAPGKLPPGSLAR